MPGPCFLWKGNRLVSNLHILHLGSLLIVFLRDHRMKMFILLPCFFALTEHSDLVKNKTSYKLTDPYSSASWNHQSSHWVTIAKITYEGPTQVFSMEGTKHRSVLTTVHLSCCSHIHLNWGVQIGSNSPHASCRHVLFHLPGVLKSDGFRTKVQV